MTEGIARSSSCKQGTAPLYALRAETKKGLVGQDQVLERVRAAVRRGILLPAD